MEKVESRINRKVYIAQTSKRNGFAFINIIVYASKHSPNKL